MLIGNARLAVRVSNEPQCELPFLWRSKMTDRVYIRAATLNLGSKGYVDVVVAEGNGGPITDLVNQACCNNEEAWRNRLDTAGDHVVLTNKFTGASRAAGS